MISGHTISNPQTKGMNLSNVGTNNTGLQNYCNSAQMTKPQGTRGNTAHPHRTFISNSTTPTPPLYRTMLLALLPGTRCYSDASINPYQNLHLPRIAGLGVFITNNQTQPTQSIYTSREESPTPLLCSWLKQQHLP